MIFSLGEAHAGEWVLPIPNRGGRLDTQWGIAVHRASSRYRLEPNVMDPDVCAMICNLFRLSGHKEIRRRRIAILRRFKYDRDLRTIVTPRSVRPISPETLDRALLAVPESISSFYHSWKAKSQLKNFDSV